MKPRQAPAELLVDLMAGQGLRARPEDIVRMLGRRIGLLVPRDKALPSMRILAMTCPDCNERCVVPDYDRMIQTRTR